jgi:hypothetical protein
MGVGANCVVKVTRVVLRVLERLESIDDDGFVRRWIVEFVEEQAVPSKSLRHAHDGRMGAFELTRDLSKTGAGEQSLEDAAQQLRALEPVGRLECLETEVPTARQAAETLDLDRRGFSMEEPSALEPPSR